MIDWLNQHMGTDWATYFSFAIGAIGLIAIFFTAKKISSRKNQSQSIKNGTGLQAGKNINIRKK